LALGVPWVEPFIDGLGELLKFFNQCVGGFAPVAAMRPLPVLPNEIHQSTMHAGGVVVLKLNSCLGVEAIGDGPSASSSNIYKESNVPRPHGPTGTTAVP